MIEQFHLLRPWWLLLLIPLAGAMWLLLKNRYDSGSWRAVIDARLLPFVLSADWSKRARLEPLDSRLRGSCLRSSRSLVQPGKSCRSPFITRKRPW